MSKSPGHRKWPNHKVREERVEQRLQVAIDGEVIADSTDVIKVDEDRNPARYYFPRSDVRMDLMEGSDKRTRCPFKGEAQYFNIEVGGRKLRGVGWSYEEPYDEHRALQDRVAFHADEMPDIEVRPAAPRGSAA